MIVKFLRAAQEKEEYRLEAWLSVWHPVLNVEKEA